MDMVKALRLGLRDRKPLDRNNLEARCLDLGEDGGGIALANGVGLDDAESTL
jgi:hypothetical protein